MCIIVYKPAGKTLPGKSTLETCSKNNPDGAGYMFNAPEGVIISKGFTDINDLLTSLNQNLLKHSLTEKKCNIALHFRIGTQGLIKAENCHPFPVTSNIGELQAIETTCDIALVHNGMIPIKDDKNPNLSDTQIFIKDILSKVDLNDPAIHKLIEISTRSSKLLFFDKRGLFHSFGDFLKVDDIYYSNSTYKPTRYDIADDLYTSKYNKYYVDNNSDNYCIYCDDLIPEGYEINLTGEELDFFGIERHEKICPACLEMYHKEFEINTL
jgi:predicted glutamine amidotransferase